MAAIKPAVFWTLVGVSFLALLLSACQMPLRTVM